MLNQNRLGEHDREDPIFSILGESFTLPGTEGHKIVVDHKIIKKKLFPFCR